MELNIVKSNLEESQNSAEVSQLFWIRRLKSFYNFVEHIISVAFISFNSFLLFWLGLSLIFF